MQLKLLAPLSILCYLPLVAAHPGHEDPLPTRDLLAYKANMRRGLDKCALSFEERGVNARAMQRRAALHNLHRRHQRTARDTDTVLNTDHQSSANYTETTPASELFGGSNACTLNPEGEVGPFFVNGELIRNNALEDQAGVPVVLEFQFVDADTCEPIADLYADVWSCNATGVYSGVEGMGNGDSGDDSILDETFLRALAPTDDEGVVVFQTLFPGHYAGRTTHHHVVAHLDATVLPNNTLSGGSVPHIGQLFWDQEIIGLVEATEPYNTNTVELTTNAEDRVFATETADSNSDPVFSYVYLGDDLSDGLLGWITIAVNQSASYTPSYSYEWTADGGQAVSGSSGGAGSPPFV